MTNTIVRPFSVHDLVELEMLISDTIDVGYAEIYPPKAIQFFKTIHSGEKIQARVENGVVLVVEENGELVGTGSLSNDAILAVFVSPRFQKCGLGKKIMHELEKMAIEAGLTEVRIDVSLPSRRFYEGLGYVITEEVSRDLGDGQKLDFWKAKKNLPLLK